MIILTPQPRAVFPQAEPFAIPRWDHERVTIPRAPEGSGPAAKRLWSAVQRDFELGEHERALLVALCRQVDRLEALEALIADEGMMVSGHGTVKVHPAVVEARQTAIAVARISACLRLPSGEEDEGGQQRRAGVRGVYSLGGAA